MARPGPEGGQYRPLGDQEIERIHKASIQVLEHTGIQVEHDGALALYRDGGARVKGRRVYITRGMIQTALDTAPERVVLAGRDPVHDVVLEGRRVYAGTGGSPTMILDPGEDTVRPATLNDLAEMATLVEGLSNCDFVVIPLHPTDVPEGDVPVNRFYACLSRSTRHVMGGVGSREGAQQVIGLAAAIAGGLPSLRQRPIVSAVTSWMVSPLSLDTSVTDILLEWCNAGLPVALSSAPMAGSTSPVSLAGTLVQLNAEQLSGIVLTQLVRPGTPVLAGYIPGVADMRSGGYVSGAIEFGMMQAGAAQLAQRYGVPLYCSGGMTDSKIPDEQAGYEKMSTLLLAAMGGCNFIHHAVGMMTNMSAVSLEQAVIDDEIVGMVMRVLRGLEVTDGTLASDAIRRVGPGGHFLMDEHTLQYMRSELYHPPVADRSNRAMWDVKGRPDTRALAIERASKVRNATRAPALAADIDAAIRDRFNILL